MMNTIGKIKTFSLIREVLGSSIVSVYANIPIPPRDGDVYCDEDDMVLMERKSFFKADFIFIDATTRGAVDGHFGRYKTSYPGKMGMGGRIHFANLALEWGLGSAQECFALLVPSAHLSDKGWKHLEALIKQSRCREICRILVEDDGAAVWLIAWWTNAAGKALMDVVCCNLEDGLNRLAKSDPFVAQMREAATRSRYRLNNNQSIIIGDDVELRPVKRLPAIPTGSNVYQMNAVRVCVNGRSSGITLSTSDEYTRLSLFSYIENEYPFRLFGKDNKEINLLKHHMRIRNLITDNRFERILQWLRAGGFNVEVDEQVERWLAKKRRSISRSLVPFEQMIGKSGDTTAEGEVSDWTEINKETGVRTLCSDVYAQNIKLAKRRISWPLWKFQLDDLARMCCKQNSIYAAFMAAGKSRMTFSYAQLRGAKRVLIVVESKLISEFINEGKKVGFEDHDIHVIEDIDDCHRFNLRRFNIVAYSRLWREFRRRGSNSGKTTIADELRKTRFNSVVFDEAHRLKGGEETKQAKFARKLRGKHYVLLSGTIARSFPKSLYPLFIQAYGEYTPENVWSNHYPLEHPEDRMRLIAPMKLFTQKFVRIEQVKSKFDGTKSNRELALVPDEALDDWRKMLAPIVLRRKRMEPIVREDVRVPQEEYVEVTLTPEEDHVNFYKWWLFQYYEWFLDQMKKEQQGGEKMSVASLLAQLTKLQFAATIPQSPKVQVPGVIEWRGGLTVKQRHILEDLTERCNAGQKWIVFSTRPEFLDLLADEFLKRAIDSRLFHGGINPMSKRLEGLREFRHGDEIAILLMSLDCGNTGYNIPEADGVWLSDYDWVPDKPQQAVARMLRASWLTEERALSNQMPLVKQATLLGTIDEYMKQINVMKTTGLNQALDYGEGHFNADEWNNYRDFSIMMFKEMGLDI
jgi:SNF2 family DNA or RNA helicase